MTAPAVRLCEASTKLEQDWRDVYASAFPLAEQESEQKLQGLIDAGRLLYHKTIGKQGELLCFSMVSLAPDFSFLAYIATDPKQRSGGYGSKHMRALIDLLKQQYPSHVGLFLEIESTNPRHHKLTDEEKNIRNRRLCFYRRLGAKRLCRGMNYTTPSLNGDGEHELDILFFNFGSNNLDHKEKQRIVSDVYTRFYNLPLTDPLVSRVLSGVTTCTHAKCEEEAPSDTGVDLCAPATPKPDSTDAAPVKDATVSGDTASPAAEVKKPEISTSQSPEALGNNKNSTGGPADSPAAA